MKQSFFTVLLLVAFLPASPAQLPLYIQFDPACMNQLEYQYTYSGQNLLMYSIAKNDNELYFFLIGSAEPVTTTYMPKGALSCMDAPLTSTLVDGINAGGRIAYLVFRVQNGYMSMPIESGGYVMRTGTYFAFRSPNYDFVIDTANLDYARNLSQPGVASPVYLTGKRDLNCLRQYSFRLEPVQPESPRADVEVIPGIGIISDRTGRNGSEMEQNVYRLLKVNGMSLDNYVYNYCQGKAKPGSNNDGSFITRPQNPNTGGYDPYDPFNEPDKEGYNPTPVNPSGNQQQTVNCPERPGYGYHLVQPGESLNYIARLYNLEPKSLITWNGIRDPNKIEVCDKIWLSQQGSGNANDNLGAGNYHSVQKGETLVGIARKYNLTEASIRQMNNFPASGNVVIQPGQRIAISKSSTGSGTGGNIAIGKPGNPNSSANNPNNLSPNLGASGRMQYRVQRGETIAQLAHKHGYTTDYFRHINRSNKYLPNGYEDVLPEGLVLTVSDAKERIDFSSYTPSSMPMPAAYGPSGKNQGLYNPDPTPNGLFQSTKQPGKFEFVGEYIVRSGDTLRSIAQQYNLSVEKLAAANNLRAGQEPQPRDILKIPK